MAIKSNTSHTKISKRDLRRITKLREGIRKAVFENVVCCAQCAAATVATEACSILTETGASPEEAISFLRKLLDAAESTLPNAVQTVQE